MAVAEFIFDNRVKISDELEFTKIRSAISDPAVLGINLVFVNTGCFIEDSVLALRCLLQERRPEVTLRTELYSNITTPDILLFLMGDIRLVKNPDIKIFIKKEDKNDYKSTGASSNRKAVNKLMQQYLPVEEFAGQWLSPKDLAAWGLLNNSPVQIFLKEFQEELQKNYKKI